MSTYYFVPSRNVFGEGSVAETGHLMKSLGGTKAMIVTDEFLASNPMTTRIQAILKEAGVDSAVFGKAEPNPKDTNVVEGETFYHENRCDCILSLGGGSSHDCAKGIGLVASNGGKIADYEGVDKAHEALPPLVAVNTTAGTASEITRFCIITDTARKVKMCIVDWRVTPAIAINDPELMVGMPSSLTAATGMDALTHAVEAYVSTDANPLTDAAAIKAIDKIVHYLPQAVANGDYMKARSEMAYAQYLAGPLSTTPLWDMSTPWPTSWAATITCPRRLQCDPAALCAGVQPDRQPGAVRGDRQSHGPECGRHVPL